MTLTYTWLGRGQSGDTDSHPHMVGRGQSGPYIDLNLVRPSAPPQVIMTLESKCKVIIQSEIIDSAWRARFESVDF